MTHTGTDTDTRSTVDLDQLDESLQLRPIDPAHVLVLAQCLDACPPILASATGPETALVVDGHHRVEAARALGRTTLPVTWVDGDQASLLEAATCVNARHGLPLTLEQRKAAARLLLDTAPDWSNRRIARNCGISEATVRRIRRPGASPAHLDSVIGADGKTYPTTAARHDQARRLIREAPGTSDRAIARATGLSPTTVGRLRQGACAHPADSVTQLRVPLWQRLLTALIRLLRPLL